MEEGFTLVEKEEIPNLHFPNEEILTKKDLIAERNAGIDRAISLGNLEHVKVKIYFHDNIGKKVVDTTIWAVTDTAIVLKKNTILPKNRIYKIEL